MNNQALSPSQAAIIQVHQQLSQWQQQRYEAYAQASNHLWFAQQLIDHQLITLLEHVPDNYKGAALSALCYAYTYPGTKEAICQLALALFGQMARVEIVDEDGVLFMGVWVDNENFYYTLAQEFTLMEELAIADLNMEALAYNPLHFLQQFLPAGTILADLQLHLQVPGSMKAGAKSLSSRSLVNTIFTKRYT